MARLAGGAMLALLSWLPLAAPAVAQDDGLPARPEITEIRFEGNEVFPAESLRLAIANRETECRTFVLKPFCLLGLGFADEEHYLQPDELRRDVVRLELYHWERGYREAQVDTTATRGEGGRKVRITFHVDEGRPVLVDTILFTGDPVPDPVLGRLPLRGGDPLSQIQIDATRDTLQARLRDRGYAHAEVLRSLFIPRGAYEAEVEYDIYTGPRARFGEIDVRWTGERHSLSRESVLRFLPFGEGDVFSSAEILRAQRSLFSVELIQSASVREDTLAETPDSVVPIVVAITEGDVHRVGAGTAWSTAECFSGEARWTSRNFLGGARRLTVRGRVSNVLAQSLHSVACPEAGEGAFARLDWLASAELLQPWIFSSRNSLSLSVFGERASLPDIFIRRAVGANVALTRSLGLRMPATLAYRPQLSELQAAEIYFCASFLVCDPDDIHSLASANWLSPVSFTVSLDRTDDLLNPSDGYHAFLELEHASGWTGSDFSYNRVVAEVDGYHPLARRTVLAGRLRGGWVGAGEFGGDLEQATEVVHPQKRFYAGGASSVRGFAQSRLGPRVLAVELSELLSFREVDSDTVPPVCTPEEVAARTCEPGALGDGPFLPRATGGSYLIEGNAEYRFAFGGEFQGVVFLDLGQVWRADEGVSLGDLELSPGVGVRWFSPVGPIRVDVGYRFRGGERLPVVTRQLRPYQPGEDAPKDRFCVNTHGTVSGPQDKDCTGDFVRIPWVQQDALAILRDPVLYGERRGWFDLQNLQLHLSIGQAF